MKHFITALLLGAALLNPLPAGANEDWRYDQCRYQTQTIGAQWTPEEEMATARCAVAHWPRVSLETLVRIIDCESHWFRLAWNHAGDYVGLAQHSLDYWPSRVAMYGPPGWDLNPDWRNSRTMLVVTVHMMAEVGYSPWSCY